jgi:hypothetical protein
MANQQSPQPPIETHGGEVKLTPPITETQGGETNPNRVATELQQAVNTFQQHGHLMTFSQLLKILTNVQVKILIAVASVLITIIFTTFKLGQTFPDIARVSVLPGNSPIQLSDPEDNLFIDNAKFSPFDESPLTEAFRSYLEDPTTSPNGSVEKPNVIKVETKPFAQATIPFTVKASSPYGSNLWGYSFLRRVVQNTTLYEPLESKIEGDGFSIKVPRTERGDSLLIVVRLNLHNKPEDLRDLLHLRSDK